MIDDALNRVFDDGYELRRIEKALRVDQVSKRDVREVRPCRVVQPEIFGDVGGISKLAGGSSVAEIKVE